MPPHIGCPTPGCGYENGDPYAAFLPPAIETDEMGNAEFNRAVVFVAEGTKKGTNRSGQEYANPLFVMTGEEYGIMSFDELLHRLEEAIRSGPRVVAEFLAVSGIRTFSRRTTSSPGGSWLSSSSPLIERLLLPCANGGKTYGAEEEC